MNQQELVFVTCLLNFVKRAAYSFETWNKGTILVLYASPLIIGYFKAFKSTAILPGLTMSNASQSLNFTSEVESSNDSLAQSNPNDLLSRGLGPPQALIGCENLTRLVNEYILSITSNLTSPKDPIEDTFDDQDDVSQKNAVMYIVVVLFFYSFGIGFMMIKYMRKEEKEQEECKMYIRYINAAHEQYLNSTNRATLANRLALQALNTVNAIPQTTQLGSKVTFV